MRCAVELERPDLDDYAYLAKGLPALGLALLVLTLRSRTLTFAELGWGLLAGIAVGLALVSILVIQLHMWKDQVARAVVAEGNPRLPIGFTLAVVVYFLGVVGASWGASHVAKAAGGYLTSVSVPLVVLAGAFLPWVAVLWPMQEVRDRAAVLYRERERERFPRTVRSEGKKSK